jgi:hypothetical protein
MERRAGPAIIGMPYRGEIPNGNGAWKYLVAVAGGKPQDSRPHMKGGGYER